MVVSLHISLISDRSYHVFMDGCWTYTDTNCIVECTCLILGQKTPVSSVGHSIMRPRSKQMVIFVCSSRMSGLQRELSHLFLKYMRQLMLLISSVTICCASRGSLPFAITENHDVIRKAIKDGSLVKDLAKTSFLFEDKSGGKSLLPPFRDCITH